MTLFTLSSAAEKVPEGMWVRPGYQLTVAESTIQHPRFLKFAPDGTLFVSVPDEGEIKACRDKDGDGVYETVTTFVKDHQSAHGMFWHDGWLWFTESGAIFRARDTNNDGKADETVAVIPPGTLPSGGHWWRPILIHKGRFYTGIGDEGNITEAVNNDREKIFSYALDGSDKQLFISGIRNTEKLVIRPGTDEIWGMDHGSDWFGGELEGRGKGPHPMTDYNPPEEMNHYVEGGFYGHPYITGLKIPRYEYTKRKDLVELAEKTIVPEWCGGAHWAANSMEFYTADQFPGNPGDAFVCYHGSWNRTHKAGYCVTRVLFENGHPYGEQVYVKFLTDQEKVLGRPVDSAVAPDGTLLITDDEGSHIYRLKYVDAR